MKLHRRAYLICPKECPNDGFEQSYELMPNCELRCGKETRLAWGKDGSRAVYVIGLFAHCTDANATDDQIVRELLAAAENSETLMKYSLFLAGHFVIIAVNARGITVVPDACVTYGIHYTGNSNGIYIASNPKIIADIQEIPFDPDAVWMKTHTNPGEALPNNRTLYKGVMSLLPNHYLDALQQTAVRVYPAIEEANPDLDTLYQRSADMLHTIITGLLRKTKLSLPITGGVDSRTILAAIGKERAREVSYYTYRHDGDNLSIGDLSIPKQITSDFDLEYRLVDLKKAPKELFDYYAHEIEDEPEVFTPNLCYTYHETELQDRCFLSGGIAPIGKSVYGNVLPECFCRTSYLLTKAHNSSAVAYAEIKKWKREIQSSCKQTGKSVFDMFYWEYRCGRWDQRTHLYTDAMIDMVSPYNCGMLLHMWLQVPRRNRQGKCIHKAVMKLNWPELLDYPLNPDSSLYSWVKRHPYLYWVLSYVLWAKESLSRAAHMRKEFMK